MTKETLKKVRIDKWLWSVRIFKSRSMATTACKSGKVKINGANVKPSQLLEMNQLVDVKKNGYNLNFKALFLIEKRVSASIAQECYENLTPADELNKFDSKYLNGSRSEIREKGLGRPTKRERRDIDDFKTFEDEDDWFWNDDKALD
jgi:ribosome-associated heat shock protein Hsp15